MGKVLERNVFSFNLLSDLIREEEDKISQKTKRAAGAKITFKQ